MGADAWMDHSGTNILQLMEKTGRLARFLSEIEAADKKKMVGETQKTSSVAKLQAREADITRAINNLLTSVESGDSITGNAVKDVLPAAAKDSAREKKLMGKLMSAADKEDKARIVEAAGDVAEKEMSQVMKDAAAGIKKEKQEINEEKTHDESEDDVTVVHNAMPMVRVRDDVVAPINILHSKVQETVNKHLDKILKLFHDRKTQKQHMSVDDYKNVNSQLRMLAAHLMQKYADKDEEVPFSLKMPLAKALTMPLASVAWMRKKSDIAAEQKKDMKYVKEHGRHQVHMALTVPLKQARKMLEPTKKSSTTKKADNGFGSPFDVVAANQALPPHQSAASKKPTKESSAKESSTKKADNGFGSPFDVVAANKPLPPHRSAASKGTTAPQEKEQNAKPNEEEQPAAQPTEAPRDPVTQFVWSTLGKDGVGRINKAHNLADLLKGGVHLRTGGVVRFAVPQ
jgi:hypothetical protein